MSAFEIAGNLLRRAAEHDTSKQYPEALQCYNDGISLLFNVLKDCPDDNKKEAIRKKIKDYISRAELIKSFLDEEKAQRKNSQENNNERPRASSGSKNTSNISSQPSAGQNGPQNAPQQQQQQLEKSIKIKDGDTGYSYTTVFSSYLNNSVKVLIEDPYIRHKHQLANFVRFCELLVTCKTVREIQLVTGEAEGEENLKEQKLAFNELSESLRQYGVTLTVVYNSLLHDREIIFDNGWIIKIGRGLDYFKKPEGRYSIGFSDWDFRSCQETTIDIFRR